VLLVDEVSKTPPEVSANQCGRGRSAIGVPNLRLVIDVGD
jgi:hypothetical protein